MDNQLYQMDPDLPGRATHVRREMLQITEEQEAWLVRMERKGAALVASHWLRCFDALDADWAHESAFRRKVAVIRKVMADARTHMPGDYSIREHLEHYGGFAVDWRNSLGKRFKGNYECLENEAGNMALWTIDPFESQSLRKPRGCTHFRFFAVLGVMCDFRYSEDVSGYVAVQPQLLGLNSVVYSEMVESGYDLIEQLDLEVGLPGLPSLGQSAAAVMGIGIEFWQYGKKVPEGKVLGRVMQIG